MMSTAREHTKQISTILSDSLLGIQTKQAILMLFLNNESRSSFFRLSNAFSICSNHDAKGLLHSYKLEVISVYEGLPRR